MSVVLPLAFEERLKPIFGTNWSAFVSSLKEPAPTSIRINPYKKYPTEGNNVPWTEFGLYLSERPKFTLDPSFHAGAYYVQEASSMFVEQTLKQTIDLTRKLNVLDVSAAPGGKSTHILSLLTRESLLVANEVIRSRAGILAENIQKWGCSNAIVTNNDPEDFNRLSGFFDVLVVDAPCSGEGLFRKDPDAIKEWSPENVDLCGKRQRRILADVWPALKEEGVLIYSTCTYNRFENEETLQWLREQHDAESIELQTESNWGIDHVYENGVHGYHFYPHKVKGEGFFISVIRKKSATQQAGLKARKGLTSPAKKIEDLLNVWTTLPDPNFFTWNETVYAIPDSLHREAAFLLDHLKFVQAGTALATIKHDKLIPEHAAALSVDLNKANFSQIEVSEEDALRYLRKEPMHVQSFGRGYALVIFKGLPLGWVNMLDSRMNNLYPKEWRIRMAG